MNIDKIKTTGDTVYIEYSEKTSRGLNIFSMQCNQRGLAEFYHKRNQLVDHVCELMELPDDFAFGMEIRTVSFTYIEEAKSTILGAVITAVKKLKNGHAIVLNTPFATEIPMGGGKNFDACLSEVCTSVLKGYQAEAIRYINGERAQMELFTKESAKERRDRKRQEKASNVAAS